MKPLTELECRLLTVLMQPNRSVREKTTASLARKVGVPAVEAQSVLSALQQREPPLVHRLGPNAATRDHFWETSYEAADAWEQHCRDS